MKSFAQHIECPECAGSLESSRVGHVCASCNSEFPIIGHVPWIQKEVSFQFEQWKAKFQLEQKIMQAEEAQIKAELSEPSILPSTRKRLNKLLQAKVEQRKSVLTLLEHLNLNLGGSSTREQVFRTKLPESIRLMGYGPNVFRDWAWESDENQTAVDLFRDTTGVASLQNQSVVTLGAGACRFAYDLHRQLGAGLSIASDINPFLLAVADRCIKGASCSLYEFPIAPINDDSVAVAHKLRAPQKNLADFYLLAADGINFPGKANSIDWVITPWFIDIIDLDSQVLAKRINRLLKPGGCWYNFGTLVFRSKNNAHNYGREEMREVLAANGFANMRESEKCVPYLDSAASAQKRSELVWSFCVSKVTEVQGADKPIDRTPSWLRQTNQAVPKMQELERDLMINQGYNLVVQQVDGVRSVEDIAQVVAGHFQLSPVESVAMVRQLFEILWNKTGTNQRY